MADPCRVLEWAYGPQFQETGRNTLGHRIVSAEDRERAGQQLANLLYGEVLPSGVTTLLAPQYLAAHRARKLVDIGSGCGKLALQAFVEFPNLESVVGVEICRSRTQVGISALRHLSKQQPRLFQMLSADDTSCCFTVDDAAMAKWQEAEAEDAAAVNAVIEEFKNGGQVRSRSVEASEACMEFASRRASTRLPSREQQQQQQQQHLASERPQSQHHYHVPVFPIHHPQQQELQEHAVAASAGVGLCHHKLLAAKATPPPPPPPSAEAKPSRLAKLASAFGGGGDKASFASAAAAPPPSASSSLGQARGNGRRTRRTLELREGNMFLCKDIFDADVVICETKVPVAMMSKLHELVCQFGRGTRLLTYDDLLVEFEAAGLSLPVRRIPCRDRVLTSWAVSYGHLFHLWERI